MKLTKAQIELLVNAANGYGACAYYYAPARKLVEEGLCEWNTVGLSSRLTITEAGRAALALHQIRP